MTVTETAYTSSNDTPPNAIASQNVKQLNGAGQVKLEKALSPNNTWDAVETKYTKLGQVWKQSRPYRIGTETPVWTENFYDSLGRVTKVVEADGSESKAFYNETTRPDSASTLAGQTVRSQDAWGRERWIRQDAQGRLVEVIEPNPNGNGSVSSSGSLVTKYTYNTLGNLTQTEQGNQIRKFAYDSLGRLTRQKLAEQTATLNDAGVYVGAGQSGANWAESFVYDNRSNLIQRTDPRGVKSLFSYQVNNADDPLNRLQSVVYDLSGPRDTSIPIATAATVNYAYKTSGDVTRLESVTAVGVSTETYAYDSQSRVSDYTLTLTSRPNYPMTTSYIYDSLDRVVDVRYPKQYPQETRKLVHHDYDVASRLSGLNVDGQQQASEIVYNSSSQTTQLKVGAAGANQVTENYSYDNQTGLLTNQKVLRGGNALMDLSYDYLRNGTTTGRTGHLTKLINNLDRNRDRAYEYDSLGRLTKAVGGINATWTQNYVYDRYGNRTGVSTTGVQASLIENSNDKKERDNINTSNPETVNRKPFDFDGDNKADASVWTRSSAVWKILKSQSQSQTTTQLGTTGDQIVPGDYDGDGKYDEAVWTASTGTWRIKQSTDNTIREQVWGVSGDVPVPGDFDGDNKTDMAVWRALSGHWWILRSSDNTAVVFWGSQSLGDIAAVGDYDGDGKSDVAVWRPSDGVWYIVKSSDGNPMYLQFGIAGDVPVPAKYDGDAKTDLAVWRPSEGTWYIQQSTNNQTVTHQLGSDTVRDILVPADYDGDNKADVAVWQQSNSTWTIKQSSDNQVVTKQLGASGDIAVPSSYIRRSSAPRGQSVEIPRDGLASVSYNTQTNRINTSGWEYDVAGNQTRVLAQGEQSWNRFEYDAANRLVKVKNDSGTTIQSFVYGATNQRLITQDGNEQSNNRTYYASVGGSVLAEYQETSSQPNTPQWSKNYVFFGDSLLSTATSNGGNSESVQYHHPDRLGTRLITNTNDTTIQEQVTLPFGTALDSESTGSTNRRFTSYDRSNVTGLDYAVNRTYDSQQGRFTQVDPIKMRAVSLVSPQTLNLYSYCGNDPINHTDPSGLFFKKLFKWIKKIFKWIVIAVLIAVAVILVVWGAPTLGVILAKIGAGLAKAGFIVATSTGAKLTLLGKLSAGLLAGLNTVGAIASNFAQTNKPTELSGADRKQWELSVSKLLTLLNDPNSQCYRFLQKAFSKEAVKAIAKDLKTQVPYDGLKSTNVDNGLPIGGDGTPKGLFDEYSKVNAPLDAVTAGLHGNIYYGNVRGGMRTSVILHENIHRNIPNTKGVAMTDDSLGRRLGTWKKKGTQDSSKINGTLEANGCK
jgi:RHS repeat-associated protein